MAATPAEVVSACDITLAMLSDPEACLAVATGEQAASCPYRTPYSRRCLALMVAEGHPQP